MTIDEATKFLETNGFAVRKKHKKRWTLDVYHELRWYMKDTKRTRILTMGNCWSGPVAGEIETSVRTELKKIYDVSKVMDIPEEEIESAKAKAIDFGKKYIDANINKWHEAGLVKIYGMNLKKEENKKEP